MNSKRVSIIIPTYNRPNTLREMIPYYLNQKYLYEIIILDDCSSVDYSTTIDYIKKECEVKDIELVYTKNSRNLGAAESRNKGVSLARGNYILWGEDDAWLSPTYIEDLFEVMSDNTIVCGSIFYGVYPDMPENEKKEVINQQLNCDEKIFNFVTFEGYYRKITSEPIEVPFGHALILVPLSAYNDVKYYPDYKVNGYREESDAQVSMLKKGYKILYTSSAVCYHLPSFKIEKGGQHMDSKIRREWYTIVNNTKFLSRHYNFIKKKYALNYPKFYIIMRFILFRMVRLVQFAIIKLK